MEKFLVSRAIRGANTAQNNTAESISSATVELLRTIIVQNDLNNDDIVSAIFTLTPDLNAEFPAKSARIELGWDDIPMVCASEIPVPGSLPMCIRVMLTVNTFKSKSELVHVYMGNAQKLRPDLVNTNYHK